MALKFILIFLISYLLGSIPFALVVSLPHGVDPRKAGSKNPGATNVARLLGKKWGILTFLGDSGKGIIALLIASYYIKTSQLPKDIILPWAAFFAVLGHLFSVFLKFKGGKGVATTIGTFLYLAPKAMLLSLVFFFVGVAITGFVSVGSLTATLLLPLFLYLFQYPKHYIISASVLTFLIWIKHKDNIKRLLKGEEKTWRKKSND